MTAQACTEDSARAGGSEVKAPRESSVCRRGRSRIRRDIDKWAVLGSILLAIALGAARGADRQSDPFSPLLAFSVTDERPEISADIGTDIILHVRRSDDSRGRIAGWWFSAEDRRLVDSPDFFNACRCGHGPQAQDLLAWHFIDHYFPAERILPIYGYPFEVRMRCVGCRTAGKRGSDAQFIAGTVEVGFRRLSAPTPGQRGTPDDTNPK
jgi:hypothetical protein